MIRITEQLKRARTIRGISATELSRATGVTNGTISRIEAGKHNPTAETIEKLCEALQCDIVIYPRM